MAVEISILGPVAATRDGVDVDLGPPQQRALLALLAIRAGTLVTEGSLVDELWPEAVPSSAAKVVQTYVSRLRKELGAETIERRGTGYLLRLSREAVDASRFEDLLTAGRVADALVLWRERPLADLPGVEALRAEADRLEELRSRAVEDHVDALIAAGSPAEAIGPARELLAVDPLRERAVAALMRALYLTGRQADALDLYRRTRARFVEELGLEPGPELRDLERRILAHDPALRPEEAASPITPAPPHRTRRRKLALAALALAVVLLAVAAAPTGRPVERPARAGIAIRPNSLLRIDPATNTVVDSFPVGRVPGAVLAVGNEVWVANDRDRTVSRVDPGTRRVETIGGLAGTGFFAADQRGNVYASGWDFPFVWRIDPRRARVVGRYRVESRAVGLAVGGGFLWVVDRLVDSVTRVDLASRKVAGRTRVGADPLSAAFGYGALWVANSDDGTVSAVRAGADRVETIAGTFTRPYGIAVGEHGVWVGDHNWSTVTRIDPDTRKVVAEIPVSGSNSLQSGVYGLAVGAGGVWVPNWDERDVVRIDPRTNRVAARIRLPVSPRGIAVTPEAVWVSVARPGEEE